MIDVSELEGQWPFLTAILKCKFKEFLIEWQTGVHFILHNGIIIKHALGTWYIASNFRIEFKQLIVNFWNTSHTTAQNIFCNIKTTTDAINIGHSKLT